MRTKPEIDETLYDPTAHCGGCKETIILGSSRMSRTEYKDRMKIFGYRQYQGKVYCPDCYAKLKKNKP